MRDGSRVCHEEFFFLATASKLNALHGTTLSPAAKAVSVPIATHRYGVTRY